jgi:uncharacterized membrane protein HdeD (DUF308 family)
MSRRAPGDAAVDSTRPLGITLLLAGLVLLLWPAATTRVAASFVGVGAVVYGIRELMRTATGEAGRLEFSARLLGLISVFGGVVIAVTPFVSQSATSTVIGVFWLITGTVEAAGALVGPEGRLERLLVAVISVAAGVLVLVLPTTSLVVIVWLAGGWLAVAGAIVLLMSAIAPGRRRSAA